VIYDGTHVRIYTFLYNHVLGYVYVADNTGVIIAVGACGVLRDDEGCYSHIKLVVNTLSGDYVRGMLNERTYDLRPYSAWVGLNATNPSLLAFARADTNIAANIEVRIDNMIITQNEPI